MSQAVLFRSLQRNTLIKIKMHFGVFLDWWKNVPWVCGSGSGPVGYRIWSRIRIWSRSRIWACRLPDPVLRISSSFMLEPIAKLIVTSVHHCCRRLLYKHRIRVRHNTTFFITPWMPWTTPVHARCHQNSVVLQCVRAGTCRVKVLYV